MSTETLAPHNIAPQLEFDAAAAAPVVLDLEQTGIPTEAARRTGIVPFGGALMVRASVTEAGVPTAPTAGRTSYTKSTQAATSKSTNPSTKGGSPDQQGDTRVDADVFTDES